VVCGFVVLGLLWSALAAAFAFLITYMEWSHHYPTYREPLRYGVQAAAAAFAFFMLLTVLVGLLATRIR
jgi:hypothetical protein